MSDRMAAVEAYQNGIVKGDDAGVAGFLADDVVVQTNFGRAEGVAEFVFTFGGQKITRVEQQILPAAPVAPAELRLTGEIKSAVDSALDNQTPMMIAYSGNDGEIHLSFRGTIQAYSDDQLAVWARDPGGGLPRHVAARPKVTLFYHDPKTRTTYTFYGRAWIADDPGTRAVIFERAGTSRGDGCRLGAPRTHAHRRPRCRLIGYVNALTTF